MNIPTTISLLLFAFVMQTTIVKANLQKDETTSIDSLDGFTRVIDKTTIAQMGAANLADLLKFTLNMEMEVSKDLGAVRTRSLEMNSRHLKILIDGVPMVSPDMFGGHVDISSIALADIKEVHISASPMAILYGSGTLAGTVNLIRDDKRAHSNIRFWIQEESVGNEYKIAGREASMGRHIQHLQLNHAISSKWWVSMSIQRDAFKGFQGDYNGLTTSNQEQFTRGYDWSPKENWQTDLSLSYTHKDVSLTYHFHRLNAAAWSYDHRATEILVNDQQTGLFTSNDFQYKSKRTMHHLQWEGSFWSNARYHIDFSAQQAGQMRRDLFVSSSSLEQLAPARVNSLYQTTTQYSRGIFVKPLIKNSTTWHFGYEFDHSNALLYAVDGSYLSQDIDRSLLSYAGFSYINWRPIDRLQVQPGLRLSGTNLLSITPSYAFDLSYQVNRRNVLKMTIEKVLRYANHRELFTDLTNEYNTLQGNIDLKPESGWAYGAFWQSQLIKQAERQMHFQVSAQFRDLRDKIAIVALAPTDPGVENYRYDNVNRMKSLQLRADFGYQSKTLAMDIATSVSGTKGSDIADQSLYTNYLVHTELGATLRYRFFTKHWIQSNYRFVSPLHFTSFERVAESFDISAIANKAPSYHLADLQLGRSFFKSRLDLTCGIRNLFNYTTINFEPNDGLDHYRGDLRPIHLGYGRGWIFRLDYSF